MQVQYLNIMFGKSIASKQSCINTYILVCYCYSSRPQYSIKVVQLYLLLVGVILLPLRSGLEGGSGEYGPGDRDAGLEMVYSL